MEDRNGESDEYGNRRHRGRISMPFIHFLSPNNDNNTSTWHSDSILHNITSTLPTFNITPPSFDDTDTTSTSSRFFYLPRKFSFQALRKFSWSSNISRTDSVVSVSYKSLTNHIDDDNLEEFIASLENANVVIDDKDENGSTTLHYAASKGKLAFVKELLEHGAGVDIADSDEWTPLLCAAKEGYKDICDELLNHGADLEHRDIGSWNALMWASYKGHPETVSVLLEHGADVNCYEIYHITPLIWAAGRGHNSVVKLLIAKSANVNCGDKYGTTPLIWACRRGNVETIHTLIKADANIDMSGLFSWTPLLVATMRNHIDVVKLLLQYKPNINTVDCDGCSPLTIACKDGYHDIVMALLNDGAFINARDRNGDSNLIHATRNGHQSIVEALLRKYADVNIAGKDHKTACYVAAEKGHLSIMKLLLNAHPDLEVPTEDGDTALLRAVRSRSFEMVKLLMDKKARVCVSDKRGDTALHIAIRAYAKNIVELLLRNPSHGQLLYRPNRDGETPYTIDLRHAKPLLSQVYGSNRLNTNADNEDILGYDLYSSTLADMLSAPSVSMPITVGLYARWGSGKNFLLRSLTDEMKIFSQQWVEPMIKFHSTFMILILHFAIICGVLVAIVIKSIIVGVAAVAVNTLFFYLIFAFIYFCSSRWDVFRMFYIRLKQKEDHIKLILQLIFCNPPGIKHNSSLGSKPVRFYFTNHSRVSSSIGGENAVVQMIGSLFDALEDHVGLLPTRLYRAFTPRSATFNSTWRWRRICCFPTFLLFEINFICLLLSSAMLFLRFSKRDVFMEYHIDLSSMEFEYLLMFCTSFLTLCFISNLFTWIVLLKVLCSSPRYHLQKAISALETIRSEGFLGTLRAEVALMIDMVRCLDGFTNSQSRLVIIVDGLDSCEQDKVLLILDAVHVLFSESNTPFIIILAIDPHVISAIVESNTRRLITESNISGRDFLKNMVHVPFYLQNSGLRKVKIAQKCAQQRKSVPNHQNEEQNMVRRMSNDSTVSASLAAYSSEKLKIPGPSNTDVGTSSGSIVRKLSRTNSRRMRLSDSISSSIASNINKFGGAYDLTRILAADDYFSDMNPRSMRRLLNIVYITGRLLKAFQIDFTWYQLAIWINIIEQWPYRTSCLILYHDANEETIDENTSLKVVYNKIRPHLPTSKEVEPLLELDRDEKKFNVFLKFHRSDLLVSDLRMFLPFTINLDPYIKKVIKEEQQYLEDRGLLMNMAYHHGYNADNFYPPFGSSSNSSAQYGVRKSYILRRQARQGLRYPAGVVNPVTHQATPQILAPNAGIPWSTPMPPVPFHVNSWLQDESAKQPEYDPALLSSIPSEFHNKRLSTLSVNGICELLYSMKEMQHSQNLAHYANIIKENNISGKVLSYCNFDELKRTLQMTFGDWELLQATIMALRELELLKNWQDDNPVESAELLAINANNSLLERTGVFNMQGSFSRNNNNKNTLSPTHDQRDGGGCSSRHSSKQTIIEKQVSLEDQMICGALQTLNEEACEDILVEPENSKDDSTFIDMPTSEPAVIVHTENFRRNSNNYFKKDDRENESFFESYYRSQWLPVFSSQQNISSHDNTSHSTANSVCSTPSIKRNRTFFQDKEKKSSGRCRSRPSSLLVSKLEDLEPILPVDSTEMKHQIVIRSSSVDGTNTKYQPQQQHQQQNMFGSLLRNKKMHQSTVAMTPMVTVTPAVSLDTMDISDNDESTPLVSDTSSPPSQINNTVKIECTKELNENVCFPTTPSDLVSPGSLKSNETRETQYRSSSDSLDISPEPYCQFTYVNEQSSDNAEPLFKTDSTDSVTDVEYKWGGDAETTV